MKTLGVLFHDYISLYVTNAKEWNIQLIRVKELVPPTSKGSLQKSTRVVATVFNQFA